MALRNRAIALSNCRVKTQTAPRVKFSFDPKGFLPPVGFGFCHSLLLAPDRRQEPGIIAVRGRPGGVQLWRSLKLTLGRRPIPFVLLILNGEHDMRLHIAFDER